MRSPGDIAYKRCVTLQPLPADAPEPGASSAAAPPGGLAVEVAAATADPSRLVGRYVRLSEVGRGSMGVVHRAWDPVMARVVALKILPARAGVLDEDVARFSQEARAAGRLAHPGIVTVYDLGEHAGDPFIVMDYIQGDSLERRLLRQPPLNSVLRIVREVAIALAHAHANGVVHRDVKPANILIAAGDQPVLTDFGLACDSESASRLTITGEALGTPAYMAPEQINGRPGAVGPATDIHALGAILHEAVAGAPPFVAASTVETFERILTDPPPAMPARADAPEPLGPLIARCLEKTAGGRPTATELAAALAAMAPVAAPGPMPAAPAPPGPAAPGPAAVEGAPRRNREGRSGRAAKASSGRVPRASSRRRARTSGSIRAGDAGVRRSSGVPVPAVIGVAALVVIAVVAIGVLGSRSASEVGESPVATTPAMAVVTSARLTAPKDGLITAERELAVEGEVELQRDGADAGAVVFVNGRRFPVRDGRFDGIVTLPDADGAHEIVCAADAGGTALARATVSLMRSAPVPTIVAPEAGAIWSVDGELTVTVRAGPDVTVTASLGGSETTLAAASDPAMFGGSVPLPDGDGERTLAVIVRDPAGNEARAETRFMVDRTPPSLELARGEGPLFTREPELIVEGVVRDLSAVTLRVDDAALEVRPDGGFAAAASLGAETSRPMTLVAVDAAGHETVMSVDIVLDAVAPKIVLLVPAEGAATGEDAIDVAGRVVDDHPPTSVKIGELDVPVGADGTFGARVPVAEGDHVIAIDCVDLAGNAAQVRRSVVVDRTAPTIALDPEPAAEQFARDRRLEAIGRLDEDRCRVTVNGKEVPVRGRTFELSVPLRTGENLIEIVATDPLGHETTRTVAITYQRKKPDAATVEIPPGTWWTPAPEQLAFAKKSGWPLWFEDATGIRFVLIPPGRFTMGSPASDTLQRPGETAHEVSITRGYYVSATEVSNAQFRRFRPAHDTGTYPGSTVSLNGDDQPAGSLTWNHAKAFCDWLDAGAGGGGVHRLATEAEWERACRAGTDTVFFWGDDVKAGAGLANGGTGTLPGDRHALVAPVGALKPNPWGLFDMAGNLWEWTGDHFGNLPAVAQTDPTGPAGPTGTRVMKSGGFGAPPVNLRSANRLSGQPTASNIMFGVRVVATRPPAKKR